MEKGTYEYRVKMWHKGHAMSKSQQEINTQRKDENEIHLKKRIFTL